MKITNTKTFLVEGLKYNWTLFKIETDAGIYGWGEATNWPGSPLIEAACKHVGDFIIGHVSCWYGEDPKTSIRQWQPLPNRSPELF